MHHVKPNVFVNGTTLQLVFDCTGSPWSCRALQLRQRRCSSRQRPGFSSAGHRLQAHGIQELEAGGSAVKRCPGLRPRHVGSCGPELELVSPAPAGGRLSTGPPAKSYSPVSEAPTTLPPTPPAPISWSFLPHPSPRQSPSASLVLPLVGIG